jgi:hypothetical protein
MRFSLRKNYTVFIPGVFSQINVGHKKFLPILLQNKDNVHHNYTLLGLIAIPLGLALLFKLSQDSVRNQRQRMAVLINDLGSP